MKTKIAFTLIAYPLQQASFLAKICNAWAVIVRKHFIPKNSISDLRSVDQIHLKQASLQVTMLWFVVLESIQKEGCGRLYHVL